MTEEQFLTEFLPSQGYKNIHALPGDRWAGVQSFIFTQAIIVGDIGEENTYRDRWCYHNHVMAEAALLEWADRNWEGEPLGWHRHPATGRRRDDGSAERETVRY